MDIGINAVGNVCQQLDQTQRATRYYNDDISARRWSGKNEQFIGDLFNKAVNSFWSKT